jgi:hypothetical protein
MSRPHRRALAAAFVDGDDLSAYGDAQLLPTRVKSGRAASVHNGVAHLVETAAIVTDPSGAVLVAKWHCGSYSVNAVPVPADGVDFATCVHCAEAARWPRGPVVYRCYDAEGDLLYIGSSIDVRQRLRAHKAPGVGGSRWWPEVDRVECEGYDTEAKCRLAEAEAIRREPSRYNRAGIVAASP